MQNVQPKVELKVERSAATILTDAKILAIRPPEKGQVEVRDRSVPGLRIRVGASGSRTFVLRKTVAGRYRNITLGRYCERFGLAEARKKARQLLSDIELKADPLVSLPAPRRQIHVTPTIRSLWPEYKAARARLARAGASTRRTPAKRRSARAGAKSGSAKPAVKRGGEAA